MTKRKIKMPTKAEDARIKKGIAQDQESPELKASDFRRACPAREVAPALVEAYQRSRGRPAGRTKTVVSLSLDKEIADALRTSGAGWQTRVNDLLKAVINVRA